MKKVSSEFEKNAQSFVKSCLYFVDIFLFSNNFIQPVNDEGYYVLVKLCKESFLCQFLSARGWRNQLLRSFGEIKESLSVMKTSYFIREKW